MNEKVTFNDKLAIAPQPCATTFSSSNFAVFLVERLNEKLQWTKRNSKNICHTVPDIVRELAVNLRQSVLGSHHNSLSHLVAFPMCKINHQAAKTTMALHIIYRGYNNGLNEIHIIQTMEKMGGGKGRGGEENGLSR